MANIKKPLCAICHKEIDLTRLHAKEKGKPVHLSCITNRVFKPEDGTPF